MAQYQGWDGFARAKAHNFWPYPVTESKTIHMVNVSRGGGDLGDEWEPGEPGEKPALRETTDFYSEGYYYEDRQWTLNPWRVESFVYAIVDDVDNDASNGAEAGPAVLNIMFTFNARDSLGHVKTPPNPTGCLLQWHNHTGAEGLATSFDPQQPEESGYMSHVYLWGPYGNRPWDAEFEAGEMQGWFRPFNFAPSACNGSNACVP